LFGSDGYDTAESAINVLFLILSSDMLVFVVRLMTHGSIIRVGMSYHFKMFIKLKASKFL